MVQSEMVGAMSDSDEFATMAKQLKKLYSIRDAQKPERVSKETVLTVVGNIVGILIIVHFEKTNVLTSKALAFVGKLR
jgi:hypothetical protein